MTGTVPRTPIAELRRQINAEIDRLAIMPHGTRADHHIHVYRRVLEMITAIENEERNKNTVRSHQ